MTDHRNVQESTAQASCAGKPFEYHERVEHGDAAVAAYGWRCPACGDHDSYERVMASLITLVPVLHRLQEQMLDEGAVFVLPSDATPGQLGEFYGRPVFRVQGLPRPLIALGEAPWITNALAEAEARRG